MRRSAVRRWPVAVVLFGALVTQVAMADDVASLSRASRRGSKAVRRSVSKLELGEVLQRVGVVLEQAGREDGAVVKWRLEPRTGRAVANRRILEASDTVGSQFRGPNYYRGKEISLNANELTAHATKVMLAFCDAILLPCEEVELTPEAPQYLNHNSTDGTHTETFVMAARVPFRARIDGVPVYDPGGTAFITYDADGTLTGIDLPLVVYGVPAAQTKSRAGGPSLAFQVHGLSAAPTHVGQAVNYRGEARRVTALRCGYYDDGKGAQLTAGCTVAVSGNAASAESGETTFFVSAQ